ncbi:terminase small subunit-like protein [Pacificimonas sp. ICDLI1SI03]
MPKDSPAPALIDDQRREIAMAIIDRIAAGEFLKTACEADGRISSRTLHRWVKADDDLAAELESAWHEHAENLYAEHAALAATANPENAQAIKVRLHALQWRIEKLSPEVRKRVEHHVTGSVDHRHQTLDQHGIEVISAAFGFSPQVLLPAPKGDDE